MGARIAVVIVLSTLFSYLHMFHTLRTEALETLERHVAERATREQAIFQLAEDNHAAFNRALAERIRSLSQEEANARFERLFVRLPDGSIRNRPEGFDGTRQVGLFVPRGVSMDDWIRRRLVAGYEVLSQYGPAFLVRFHVPTSERLLRLGLERATNGRVRIELHDNGIGIAPEMLTRIFQFDFTTRAEGHGFGLHSSALAAQELGGTLTVHGDGPGKGATFTLEIPYHPVQEGT